MSMSKPAVIAAFALLSITGGIFVALELRSDTDAMKALVNWDTPPVCGNNRCELGELNTCDRDCCAKCQGLMCSTGAHCYINYSLNMTECHYPQYVGGLSLLADCDAVPRLDPCNACNNKCYGGQKCYIKVSDFVVQSPSQETASVVAYGGVGQVQCGYTKPSGYLWAECFNATSGVAVCGNRIKEPGEQCEENFDCFIHPDATWQEKCSNCQCIPACGDGVIDSELGEECEDHSDCGQNMLCNVESYGGWDACHCKYTECGDGMKEGNEECDDGNYNYDDGCSDCSVDEGWDCGWRDYDTCSPICGDGRIVGDEECDDGNTVSFDGCSSTCMIENPQCGNGRVEIGEECDGDPCLSEGDYCDSSCECSFPWWPYCGDGICQTFEQWHTKTIDYPGPPLNERDFGSAIAPLGDIDGDGVPDVAIGADGHFQPNNGEVFIVRLNADGTVKASDRIAFPGTTPQISIPNFGGSIAPTGDLDGNSVVDIAVGTWGASDFDGEVWVFLLQKAGNGSISVKSQYVIPTPVPHPGNGPGSYFGLSMAQWADGKIAISSKNGTTGGDIWIYTLTNSGVQSFQKIPSTDLSGFAGRGVAALGDMNNDGVNDLAVRTPSGFALVYMKINGTVLSTKQLTVNNAADVSKFSISIGSLGDMDGNGVTDVIIGGAKQTGNHIDVGSALKVNMRKNGSQHAIESVEQIYTNDTSYFGFLGFGSSVGTVGDIDSDGEDDFMIGAERTFFCSNGTQQWGCSGLHVGSVKVYLSSGGPKGCASDCHGAGPDCGNGIPEQGEECDDGNTSNYDACLNSCENAECGDGYTWVPFEECDDGNTVSGDGCSELCTLESGPFCGDGHIDPGEECDDGNTINTDACTNVCEDAACGDGFKWTGHEECDDGNTSNTDACLNSCEQADCGDSYIWVGREECEPPGTATCTAQCRVIIADDDDDGPVCGDGDREGAEECDDGNRSNHDACLNTCQAASCGDGLIWIGREECEPPNAATCDAQCNYIVPDDDDDDNSERVCGNGRLEWPEECEPPGTSTCDDSCHEQAPDFGPRCGNRIVEGSEECEPPSTVVCDAYCKFREDLRSAASICGNRLLEAGEECETNAQCADDEVCAQCSCTERPAVCGNGVLEGPEDCESNTDCASGEICESCTCSELEPGCGNNVVEAGEECESDFDCGIGEKCDACSCAVPAPVCGDGKVEGTEECEKNNQCESQKCTGCRCEAKNVVAGKLSAPICGDGFLSEEEECDDGNTLAGDGCSPECAVEALPSPSTPPPKAAPPPEPASPEYSRREPEPVSKPPPLPKGFICGNSLLEFGEECDDGNRNFGDGCSEFCMIERKLAAAQASLLLSTLPQAPITQPLPASFFPVQTLAPLVLEKPVAGDTGPAAVLVMTGGAAVGWALSKRKRKQYKQ